MANTPADEHAAELVDRPPFWSWRAIYMLVVGALAVEVALMAVMSRVLR